jgi:AGZA family xanthine/uracil permease-like MFS transporter
MSLKYSFAVGIGLFLAFIGLNEAGIVILGTESAPVKLGDVTSIHSLLAILGFLIIAVLLTKRVKGSVLIGILTVTFLSFFAGIIEMPTTWIKFPDFAKWFKSIAFKLDIIGALSWGFFSVILTVFIMDFVDTIGTLIGVSAKAGLLDKNGELPEMEKPMLADAVATIFGSLCGTTTCGTYIESAAGIEEGGKTGLTSLVTAGMFLLALFFAPLFNVVPAVAYGPALVIVGLLMLNPITKIDFSDYTEVIPAFSVIVLMSFTYNIGVGITAGFVLYPLFKIISKRTKEIRPALWILFALSLMFFIFYPYA